MGAPVVGEEGMSGGRQWWWEGGCVGRQAWSVFLNDPQVHNKKGPAVQL